MLIASKNGVGYKQPMGSVVISIDMFRIERGFIKIFKWMNYCSEFVKYILQTLS